MSAILEQIDEFPNIVKILVTAGVLLLLFYFFWQMAWKEELEKVERLTKKVGDLDTQILKEQRIARNLGKFRREVEELDLKLAQVTRELPSKKEIPELLATISDLAKSSGLEVLTFRPRGESARDFVAQVPVDIIVEGTFHDVASFFDEVGQLDRIVNISDFAFRVVSIKAPEVKLGVSYTATTFRFLEAEERPDVAGADSSRRRRRGGRPS